MSSTSKNDSILIYTVLLNVVLFLFIVPATYLLIMLNFKLRPYEISIISLYAFSFLIKSLTWTIENFLEPEEYSACISIFIMIDVFAEFLLTINLYQFLFESLDVFSKLKSENMESFRKNKKMV